AHIERLLSALYRWPNAILPVCGNAPTHRPARNANAGTRDRTARTDRNRDQHNPAPSPERAATRPAQGPHTPILSRCGTSAPFPPRRTAPSARGLPPPTLNLGGPRQRGATNRASAPVPPPPPGPPRPPPAPPAPPVPAMQHVRKSTEVLSPAPS